LPNKDTHIKDTHIKDIPKGIVATPQTYGRPDINEVIVHLEAKVGSLDGGVKKNRQYAKLLIDRFKKDYPQKDPVYLIKFLIDGGLTDDFHAKNITGFIYLYYNAKKIIEAVKSRKKKGGVLVV
jgi:hypothetical protein